ncbi:MAG: DUF3368 domain-containing protein [Chloroflexota bacterium]
MLARAKHARLIPLVRPLLDAACEQGFHITQELYVAALRLVDEEIS